MKSRLKKRIEILMLLMAAFCQAPAKGEVPISGFRMKPDWRIGAEVSPAYLIPSNRFLKRGNPEEKNIRGRLSGAVRADFSFNPASREGILYKGLYQGLGIESNTFFAGKLLGNPTSLYVYQGAPFVNFNPRLRLGYEWQFGAAFGWKHFDMETAENNAVVSTKVTAHMALGLKLDYRISDCAELSLGVRAGHFSNGNTSWPNAGLNSVGASIGFAYLMNPPRERREVASGDASVECEADRGRWIFDVMAYGAWRKRVVNIGVPPEPQLCPGRFGVAGMTFSPLRKLNRWVAVGPSLDLQWDESAGLDSYWIVGSFGEELKFQRPPFGKQISVGVSAHAELTMPIFSVNVGLGYDFVTPEGDRAFYQSLTLKTFVTRNLYLNVGYRLGSFHDPQNLMLGVGFRF